MEEKEGHELTVRKKLVCNLAKLEAILRPNWSLSPLPFPCFPITSSIQEALIILFYPLLTLFNTSNWETLRQFHGFSHHLLYILKKSSHSFTTQISLILPIECFSNSSPPGNPYYNFLLQSSQSPFTQLSII